MDKKTTITVKKNDFIHKFTSRVIEPVDWSIVTSVDDMTIYAKVIARHYRDVPITAKSKEYYHGDLVSAGYTIIYDKSE